MKGIIKLAIGAVSLLAILGAFVQMANGGDLSLVLQALLGLAGLVGSTIA